MNRLDQLLVEIFDDEAASIGDETLFPAVPGWDSLKHVELVVGIEARFDIDLTSEEIARLTSKSEVRQVLGARGRDV